MNYTSRVFAVALAEMRSARRLVRTWLFVVVGAILSVVPWIVSSFSFIENSAYSPFIGLTSNVRYTFSNSFGGMLFLVFSIGIVFLAFDVRVRDRLSRIHEVLDSRPIDNFSYLLGRTLGIMTIVSLPMIATMSVVTLVALATQMVGSFQFESPQPHSFWYTVLIDVIPNMFFYTAFVVFLSMVLRMRLLVILLAIGVMVLQVWLVSVAPIHLLEVLMWVTSANFPSDLDTFFTNGWILLERLMLVLLGLGFLYIGALAHYREDGQVVVGRIALGTGLLILGVLGFSMGFANVEKISDQREAWKVAHIEADRQQSKAVLDLTHLQGKVRIEPGNQLDLDLDLAVEVTGVHGSDGLAFSFNPDLEIQRIEVNDEQVTDFSFSDGLLTIRSERHFRTGEQIHIRLVASGIPNNQFEYLDSAIDVYSHTAYDAPYLRVLGQKSLVFDRDFVALTAEGAWYPQPGPHLNRDRTSRKPLDFFEVDIEVEVPKGWTAVGPGAREIVLEGDSTTVRYRPTAPLPSVNLFADEFHRVATEVSGVEFELLVHPDHQKNLPLFLDILPEIEELIESTLSRADRFGVSYPLKSLSLVEVPSTMRVYGGGWRMDTVQTLPGILLLKELSFPTVNFANPTDFENRSEWDEERRKEFKLALLQSFVKNDTYGGNVFLGFARNLFAFQTAASGDGAEALNIFFEKLVDQLVVQDAGFFSAHLVANFGGVSSMQWTSWYRQNADTPSARTGRMRNWIFSQPSIWENALQFPLSELPFEDDPQTAFNVLELKVSKLAQMVSKGVGQDQIAKILSALLDKHRGGSFTHEEFQQTVKEQGIPLTEIMGDWLFSTELPGYEASESTVVRVNDDVNEFPQYQSSFYIRNGESTPGVVVIEYEIDDVDMVSEAIKIPGNTAVRINLVTSELPEDIEVETYVSLNRTDIEIFGAHRRDRADIPKVDEDPRPFVEISDWALDLEEGLVVDDLDDGFTTDPNDAAVNLPGPLLLFSGLMPDTQMDSGLPVERLPVPDTWHRNQRWGSYGHYRKTLATIRPGSEIKNAYFTTDIPQAGKWNLDYHIPIGTRWRSSRGNSFRLQATGLRLNFGAGSEQGSYDIEVQHGDEKIPIEFDSTVGVDGWNSLGSFELPADSVSVRVSSKTSGDVVFADAIRWTPVGTN